VLASLVPTLFAAAESDSHGVIQWASVSGDGWPARSRDGRVLAAQGLHAHLDRRIGT